MLSEPAGQAWWFYVTNVTSTRVMYMLTSQQFVSWVLSDVAPGHSLVMCDYNMVMTHRYLYL